MRMILINHLCLSRCFFWQYLPEVMHKPTNTLRRASALGLALTCVSVSLSAEAIESDAATNQELLPYVVVATRTPLGLDRVSPSVSYISAEEMKLWQGRALSDVLTQEAGMVVVSSGAKGAQTSLFTRGTNSDHTAFFLDGRRLNSGFGNQYGLERLPLDNLISVQIQKGASSVNYGSSGIGGVVDLRSRSAFDVDGNTATLSGEAGSNDYAGGAFSTAFSEERLGVSVSGSALTTENERKNDDYKYEGVSSRIDYLLTDTLSLEFVGQYDYTEKELPGSTVAPSPFDEQSSEDWLVSPGIRYATDELTVHVFYSHSESHIDLYQEKGAYDEFGNYLGDFPVSNDSEVKSDEVNLQVDYSASDDLLITTGMVYRNDDVTNSNLNIFNPLEDAIPYSETFEQAGVYTQLLWLLGDLELRAGLRYDDYSEFDEQTTGNLEVVYQLESINAALFSKVATSYAPPGAADIAFDSNLFFSDASTQLEPEESTSYEIGWRQSLLGDKLAYSLVFFHNDIDQLIDFVFDPMTFNSDAINVEEATTEGFEFQATYTGIKGLELALGYTYMTAVADQQDDPRTAFVFGAPDAAQNVRLARRPRHLLQLSAIYQFTEDFSAGVQGVGHFDREDFSPVFVLEDAEDYFVVGLVADWQVNDVWSIFARVENLLDESYAPAAGFPSLGRTGYIGARLSF